MSEKRSSLSYVITNPNCDLKLEEGDIIYLIRPSPIRTQKTFITRGNSIRIHCNRYVSKTNRKNREKRDSPRKSNSSINTNSDTAASSPNHNGHSNGLVTEDSVTLDMECKPVERSNSKHSSISDDLFSQTLTIPVPILQQKTNTVSNNTAQNSSNLATTQTYYTMRPNQSVECTKLDVTSHLPQVTVI